MRTITKKTACRVSLLAVLSLLAAGCTYTAVPRSVPLLASEGSVRYNGIAVMLTNAEKDNALSPIPTAGRETSSFKANRQTWCRVLVESLARELARRGAAVRSTPRRAFAVTLPEIVFVETRDAFQFKVKATITSGKGWSKEYSGSASVSATSVLSIKKEADRLSGQALANVLQQVLNDDEFVRQVRTP